MGRSRDVGPHRERGRTKGGSGDGIAEFDCSRFHIRGVKGTGDLERDRPSHSKLTSVRDHPLDGDVAFDNALVPGRTAERDRLKLVLPKDGSWVEFIVAGKFPRASSADKDAVIEVHRDRADGLVLRRHPLMVRIRKDHRKLTDHERDRFLEALRYLRWTAKTPKGKGLYREFVTLHTVATGIHPNQPYPMPDMGHGAPAFIAWHRAFLLQFERALQVKFPDVALPYWVMPEDSKLFTQEFMGENVVLPSGPNGEVAVEADFDAKNPLFGWTIDMSPLPRFAKSRTGSVHI